MRNATRELFQGLAPKWCVLVTFGHLSPGLAVSQGSRVTQLHRIVYMYVRFLQVRLATHPTLLPPVDPNAFHRKPKERYPEIGGIAVVTAPDENVSSSATGSILPMQPDMYLSTRRKLDFIITGQRVIAMLLSVRLSVCLLTKYLKKYKID